MSATAKKSSQTRKTLQLVLIAVAALVLAGNFVVKSLGDDVAPAEGAEGSALATLETLTVQDSATEDGYDREADFGSAWQDADDNGCDTRNDMLQRDLEDIQLTDGDTCEVRPARSTTRTRARPSPSSVARTPATCRSTTWWR